MRSLRRSSSALVTVYTILCCNNCTKMLSYIAKDALFGGKPCSRPIMSAGGYLHEDFRLFHLSSALAEDTAFHYHEFHKLVFFWPGAGTTSSRDARTRCGRMTWCLCGRGDPQGTDRPESALRTRDPLHITGVSPYAVHGRLQPGCLFPSARGWAELLSCGRRPGGVRRCCAHWMHSRRKNRARPTGMTCSRGRRCCSCWSCSAAG